MIRRFLAATTALCLLLGVTMAMAATLPPGGSFTDDDGNIHEQEHSASRQSGNGGTSEGTLEELRTARETALRRTTPS